MKILLLYKGYIPLNQLDTIFREPIENTIGSIIFDVAKLRDGKVPAAEKREWANLAKNTLEKYQYILIADSDWFKVLTKNSKAETTLGMAQNSPNFNSKVFYCPSQYIYQVDPEKHQNQFKSVLEGILKDSQGKSTIIEPEIHKQIYPMTVGEIKRELDKLLDEPMLFSDIEAKSLKVTEAGIYTIGFSKNKHEGIAFPVDAIPEQSEEIRGLLRQFFEKYQGKLVFHKANYDVAVLNYTLFQQDLFDIKGQLNGLNTFFRNNRIDDTLIITYLATNSCSGNILGLKELAQPYCGDWAVEVSDVTKVPLEKLLQYNLIDCLATAYVYETYYPKMVEDEQERIYNEHFLPYLKDTIRCQLNGLPINHNEVLKFQSKLNQEESDLELFIRGSKVVRNAEQLLAEQRTVKRNVKLKKKQTTVEDNYELINLHSGDQLRVLVYEVMQLPVIETTDSGLPSTSKGVLKDLISHTSNQEYKDILQALCDLADVAKINTAFIPPFLEANKRLLGYFNLYGTVSGRLSSNSINLQQLPATGSRFAKPTKKCFKSTDEWLFVGADYNALEARIDALTTKDPNKLKVFSEGWDNHCLNAVIAFGHLMPDIDPNDKESVNSIKSKYPEYRQAAKSVGFALQYGGQASTLVRNSKIEPELANSIYENYHKAYEQSLKWKEEHFKKAMEVGYVTVAFGLRLRTPLLLNAKEPLTNLQEAEKRTAGNALGQGWGMLNSRAMNRVMKQVDELGLSEDVLPVALIHDATYYLVRNDINVLLKLNELVVKESYWNNHPDIYHPEVGLGGQLDIFYPDWSTPLTLPEDCTKEQLIELAAEHKKSLSID